MGATETIDLAGCDVAQLLSEAQRLVSDDDHAAHAFCEAVGREADQLVEHRRLEDVVQVSAKLDRVVANLDPSDLRGYLLATLDRLDRGAVVLSQIRDAEARAAEAGPVRERVLEYVASHHAARSGDVAEALDLARSQVSRALRQLSDQGLVQRVPPPAGATRDGREHFYDAVRAHAAAA
ncbi:MAG TPA: helix-turn-helix domain-containing protein [Baekduia sp.]